MKDLNDKILSTANLNDLQIHYYRFQFNFEAYRPSLSHPNHNVFTTVLDSIREAVNFLHIEELKIQLELWLEQHYGACTVKDNTGKILYKIQNTDKFIEQMKTCGIKASIQNLYMIK